MRHYDYTKPFSTSVGPFVPFLVFFDNSKLGFCNAVTRTSSLSFQELQRNLNFHQIVLCFVSPLFVEILIQWFEVCLYRQAHALRCIARSLGRDCSRDTIIWRHRALRQSVRNLKDLYGNITRFVFKAKYWG